MESNGISVILVNPGYGKNAMAMPDVDEFERHTGGAFNSIFVSSGRTKAAVTAKSNKLEVTAVRARVHGSAK